MDTKESADDIEQNFLTQFSCMGTTDHEELVSQFQKIANGRLTYSTARFFLDMNNWNLPAAVGCYFDFMATSNGARPAMMVENIVTEDIIAEQNTEITLSWMLRNNGDTDWPEGCYLINIKPKFEERPIGQMFPVPTLKPNDTVIVNALFTTPIFQCVKDDTAEWSSCRTEWVLSTPDGTNIGQVLVCNVRVARTPTMAQWLRQNDQNVQLQQEISTVDMDDMSRCLNGIQQMPQALHQQLVLYQDNATVTQPQATSQQPQQQQSTPNQPDDFEMS